MTFDPKVRGARPPSVRQPSSPEKPAKSARKPKAQPAPAVESSFEADRKPKLSEGLGDAAEGRRIRGGVADDSVGLGDAALGRRIRGGVADDSVGLGDTSDGRTLRGGVADDSVGLSGGVGDSSGGRRIRGGVADDSIGVGDVADGRTTRRGGVADDSIGRAKRGGVADDSIGGKPWAGLVGPETDPNALALRNAVYARLENPTYLSAPEAAGAVNLATVTRELTGSVTASQADKLLAAARGDKTVATRLDRSLTALGSAAAQVKSSLLSTFASAPSGAAGAIVEHVAESAAFKNMSVTNQLKLASVMGRVDDRGLRCLGLALEKYPEVLADKDSQGGTLLDNLAKMASQPLNSKLYANTSSDQLLTSTLVDIANPNRIDQGTAPTCTVTSMQFELVADEPSEYARLMADLTGPKGTAKMRGGGELTLDKSDGVAAARDGRSISQALFQSAAMEYANGDAATFDPVKGTSTRTDTGETYAGLKPGQQTQILRNLFGVNYETKTLYSEADGQKELEALKGYDASANLNRPVLLEIDQGSINHAVSLERIADGRVFFRDPYGTLRSMDQAKFAQVVVAVHQPRN
jgi:hypothetical protein